MVSGKKRCQLIAKVLMSFPSPPYPWHNTIACFGLFLDSGGIEVVFKIKLVILK